MSAPVARARATPLHPAPAPQHSTEGYISDILKRLPAAQSVCSCSQSRSHPSPSGSAALDGRVYIGYSQTAACGTERLLPVPAPTFCAHYNQTLIEIIPRLVGNLAALALGLFQMYCNRIIRFRFSHNLPGYIHVSTG